MKPSKSIHCVTRRYVQEVFHVGHHLLGEDVEAQRVFEEDFAEQPRLFGVGGSLGEAGLRFQLALCGAL